MKFRQEVLAIRDIPRIGYMLDVGDIPGLGDHSAGLISFGPECCTMSMPGVLSRSTTLAEAAGRTKVSFTCLAPRIIGPLLESHLG